MEAGDASRHDSTGSLLAPDGVPSYRKTSRERVQSSQTIPAISLIGIAFILVLRTAGAPLFAIAVPAVALGTMFCFARPAAALWIVLFLTGFIGTIAAHTAIAAESLAQSLLVCLWLAVIARYATGQAKGTLWFWPGLAIPSLYLVVTAVGVLIAENPSAAFTGFKLSAWYMAAFLLIAVAPWPAATLQRVVRGVAIAAIAVGAYAVFRKIVGSSEAEVSGALAATGARPGDLRFFGSFLGPQQLAAWGAAAIPFLLGMALVWRGRWRLVAALGLGLCTFATLASDIRTGVVAAVAGAAFVLLLLQLCRAFKGPRLAVGLVALIAMVGVGGIAYSITISGSDSSSDRFENLLSPGDDFAYQQRSVRWAAAIEDINDQPLGYGLGTAGYAGVTENVANFAGPANLDSSYLKIGLEQGYPVLALYIVALLVLLGGIARRAIATPDRWRAAMGIAACGTLVTEIVLFYGSTYVEGIPVLFAWILIGLGAAPFAFVADPDEADADNYESAPPKAETANAQAI